ncbi:thiamine pyrophosphate-binding protein [Arsenicicoccus piscis]|uniref:Thiamine pyrophosphate enzyme N-terminal TPP-binding domain-containing protein n=1 Tax=Arsenicicoccus piscis TaxID=673954 RepID=A0ABQ6HJ78_9MICO|nr:thiamine pyrophosphate-binding protein [Arsenicicoccus piscis]GMA18230.1 hypothetical protein GCM10025862_02510 [Arsenicicoccus piscis]
MHPSQALASVVVDELVRHGVTDVVLCPGSRSAPFAYAVQEADRHGRLRLHVRVDERSAGFLALGLAKGSGTPTPVITTSGTAVANLHPAVLEAHHANVPLLVISCDRPPELRGTGANQTTVQPGLFAGAVRYEVDLGAPEADVGAPPASAASAASPAADTTSEAASRAANAYWRSTVSRAVAACRGVPAATPGPAHLNVPLRDPLAPDLETLHDSEDAWATGTFAGRPDGRPWVAVAPPTSPWRTSLARRWSSATWPRLVRLPTSCGSPRCRAGRAWPSPTARRTGRSSSRTGRCCCRPRGGRTRRTCPSGCWSSDESRCPVPSLACSLP